MWTNEPLATGPAMPKRYKILYFHHAIGLGGAPKSLSLLIAGLDKSRFEPIVVMPKRTNNDQVKKMFLDAGAEVIEEVAIRPFHGSEVAPCTSLKSRAYAVLAYNRLVDCAREIVSKVKPNIVHLNSTCIVGAAKGVHLAFPTLPVIAHVREPLLSNWWGRNLARMNRKHVNRFISIDKYGLQTIGGKADQVGDVIYNFVDRNKFRADPQSAAQKRMEIGWDGEQTVFLFLSRVSPSNGALELAKLVSSVAADLDPSARFAFAGFKEPISGYAAEAAKEIDQSLICERLAFDPDPVGLINAADVVIAPFTTPHSARSVFEGAALGKPAMVSDVPNLLELIVEGETGFSFSLGDPLQFVSVVEKLCDAGRRQQFGRAASDFARENFDQQANVLKTVAVYQKLLDQR